MISNGFKLERDDISNGIFVKSHYIVIKSDVVEISLDKNKTRIYAFTQGASTVM